MRLWLRQRDRPRPSRSFATSPRRNRRPCRKVRRPWASQGFRVLGVRARHTFQVKLPEEHHGLALELVGLLGFEDLCDEGARGGRRVPGRWRARRDDKRVTIHGPPRT